MEYGNGRATMIELDMVYVSYFGDFLSKGSRECFEQNILFRLSPPRKAAAKGGLAWLLRNTALTRSPSGRSQWRGSRPVLSIA